MPGAQRLLAVLDWLRAGYPAGVPPTDYLPLLALLRRRLTEAEVREVATAIASAGEPGEDLTEAEGGLSAEIGVHVVRITDALPSEADIARVESRLVEHHGWPVDPA